MQTLKGVTVLDISRLLPGGYASLLLVELGARVIKIEQPGVGDYYRAVNPGKPPLGGSQVFVLNQGKESLGLDLKDPHGKEIFKKLVRKADVVIENFRPGTLKNLGLGYPVLKRINPKLILCSITGFGQKGSKSRLAGHDLNYLGLVGLLARVRDGERRMIIPDFQVVDLAAAMEAAVKISAALYARKRTRRGCRVDCSMVDAGLSLARLYSPRLPERPFLAGGVMRYGIYETMDGKFMTLAALEPKFWARFCEMIGRPEWVKRDSGFEFRDEVKQEELKRIFKTKPRSEWVMLGEKADCCLFPVEEERHLPQRKRAPNLGEQTVTILKSLGYKPDQVKKLKAMGVVD